MFSCWQLYDANWIGGNFVFLKEVTLSWEGKKTECLLGAATGGGQQGVEIGAGDRGEEQGGLPCAWPPQLPSWTRNQVKEC